MKTNAGIDFISAQVSGTPGAAANYMALTANSTAPAAGDTTLTGEIRPNDGGNVSVDGDELDKDGWPWSADLHAATRSKTTAGLWRMQVGVSRPDPKPGFPKKGDNFDL